MHRIYFLLPSLEDARGLVKEFRDSGVGDDRLHLVSRREAGMEGLPEATVAQSSDLVPALKRGVLLGAGAGVLGGIVAAVSLPVSTPMGFAVIAIVTLVGAGIGSWAAAMVGAGMDRQQVADTEDAMGEGAVLMMVDVPDDEVEIARQRVLKRHPEIRVKGTEHLTPGTWTPQG
ncbi:MAG: hypothetical protein WDZ65_06900 [Aquisalimonadaceae bacterium]